MKVRGTGSYYRRGKIFWIQYSYRGKAYRESTRSTLRSDALKLLRLRQSEMAQGRLGPDAEKVTFQELVDLMREDYQRRGNRTWERIEHALLHLRPVFGKLPALAIDYRSVSRYIARRLDVGAAPGTVHHEVAALGRMLKLGVLSGRLVVKPTLPTIQLNNVRKGFFTDEEVHRVLAHLPRWFAAAIEFAWRTGWRIGEVRSLTWAQVDFAAGVVRLEPGTTKNREGRTFPFRAYPALDALLTKQQERTLRWQQEHDEILNRVFWRDGMPLGDHRDIWRGACRKAGLPGRLVHDLRRSAVRNLERAGVPRSAAMKLTGHLTESVYRRYAIVSEADLSEAVGRLAVFQGDQLRDSTARARAEKGTGTVLTQFGEPATQVVGSAHHRDDDPEPTTHRSPGSYDGSPFAAARPATVPLDQLHWKLNPPSLPSTSSTSPQR